jgi:hypothetical protein
MARASAEIVIAGGVRSGTGSPSAACSSPLLAICSTMSLPPTSSPSMYSCGIVGQSPYCLMPSRISGSDSTSTWA